MAERPAEVDSKTRFIDALAAGSSWFAAATEAGVTSGTIWAWMVSDYLFAFVVQLVAADWVPILPQIGSRPN